MLRFYTDTHIARAITKQLWAKGIDIIRCEEVDMAEAMDNEHLIYATEQGRILISQDDDFICLDVEWKQDNQEHGGIMYLPPHLQGEAQISYAIREVIFYEEAAIAGAIDYDTEIANHVIYL